MSILNNPLVSVVIPLYNSKDFINETLQSCFRQTYKNLELIIVDDGSKDESPAIAENLLKEWGGKYVLHTQENGGGCVARNMGVSLAHGHYIQFLDNDDALEPEKIERQIEALRKYGFAENILAMGEWRGIEKGTQQMADAIKHDYSEPVDLMVDMFIGHWCVYPNTFLIPKVLVLAAGPWNQLMVRDDDGEFFSRVYSKARKIVFTSGAMALYRFGNDNSLSKVEKPHLIEGMTRSSLAKCNILLNQSKHPRVKDAMYEELTCHLRLYYPYYSYLRRQPEAFIKKNMPEMKIVYPYVPLKSWIYYFLVKLGVKKSNLKP